MHRTLTASAILVSLLSLSGCLVAEQEISVGSPETGSGDTVQVLIRAMPKKGDIRDERHGKETWFAYGAVGGVNETPANGVATAHFLEDGTYILDIQINIAAAGNGMFYEAWLKGSQPESWISVGRFASGLSASRQSVVFESSEDLRDRLTVAVTLEKNSENSLPSEVVAEGVLKVTKR